MRAVRKQFYITAENERKLKRLAARKGCTEAALIRKAIDQMEEREPTPDEELDEYLRGLGVEVPKRRMSDDEFEAGLRAVRRTMPKGLDLAKAVWEDREGR